MVNSEIVSEFFRDLQLRISSDLEKADGKGKFREDQWKRNGGGGGQSRILTVGNVIEKGGVNFSNVYGKTPEFLMKHYGESEKNSAQEFLATGVSIVIHPVSPEVPIIHMNVRYFENGDQRWFGGGIDLTPHYIDRGDAEFFHRSLKKMCDVHDATYYDLFKKQADDYFYIPHRNETRGIGGIFFDHMNESKGKSFDDIYSFVQSTGNIFSSIYTELIHRNGNKHFDEQSKHWQKLRRGRYVEFNLVYDRGTKFGLETGGRTESILMSLPPEASWIYDYEVVDGSREAETQSMLKKGIDWL